MNKQGWKKCKLNNLGSVGRGKSKCRPRNDPSLYGGNFPFIQTSDVKEANLYINNYGQTYNEKGLAQSKLWDPGTLCITIAANIGETAILGIKACFPDSIVGFQADESKCDVRFIKYYIDTLKLQMQSISRGTTQDNLSLDKLLSFEIMVPPLSEQKQIASILSTYDDLIENNTRRIRILEEMAQAIYREWFVHFRYPGHEGVRLVESAVGEVPEGWELKPFSAVTNIDPLTPLKNEALKPFIEMRGLSTDSMIINWSEWRKGVSGSKFINRDTLFPRITPCLENGKNGFVQCLPDGVAGIGSTEFIVFREKELPAEMIYFISRDEKFREHAVKSMVGASGRQRVRKESFDNFIIPVPPNPLLRKYHHFVNPIFKTVQILANKNSNLRQQRDLLLPKLVNGELDIEKIEMATNPQ